MHTTLLSLLAVLPAQAANYPTVKPSGQPGEASFIPKRWKGNGLNTDKHLSGNSDQSQVQELTAADFERRVGEYKGALVAFVMKDTGQSDGLLIEFGKLGLKHHDGSKRILIAKVDAIAEPALAKRHSVVHTPTIWWYVNGKPSHEYPVDATRFDEDLTQFMERQLAPAGAELPSSGAATWASDALRSSELSVLGYFERDDHPLLVALRRAVLLRDYVSAAYTASAPEYASAVKALQVVDDGSHPLIIVKPYDERVVLVPTAELLLLSQDEMVAAVNIPPTPTARSHAQRCTRAPPHTPHLHLPHPIPTFLTTPISN